MIANGWTEEVRELLKFYSSDSQALQSIGYRQIVQHLKGNLSLEAAAEEIKKRTRAYARRQITWFRADKTVEWVDSGKLDMQSLGLMVQNFIKRP